jgi:hypothetical protein
VSIAAYNALTWICAGLAAILGLVGYSLVNRFNKQKPGCLCFILCGLCIWGTLEMNGLFLSLVKQSTNAIRESAFLKEVMRSVDVRHNAFEPHYTISCTPQEELHSKEPYLAVMCRENEETGLLEFSDVIHCTLGDVVTEEMIAGCETICLCISDYWATAQYTGTTSGTGTSERVQCYLYDVQEKTVFAMEVFKAKGLPDTTARLPNYRVDHSSIMDFIKAHMK